MPEWVFARDLSHEPHNKDGHSGGKEVFAGCHGLRCKGCEDSGSAGNESSGRAGNYVTPSTSLRTQIENGATTDFCPSKLFGSEPNDSDLVGRGWHSLQREHRGQRLLFDSSRLEDRHLVRADGKTHNFRIVVAPHQKQPRL